MKARLIDLLWSIGAKMPFCVLYVLSDIIYGLLYHCVRYRRKVVRQNLQNSFPDKTEKERLKIERDFYHHFCDYVVETIKMHDMDSECIKRHIRFEGLDILNRYTDQGRSCVVYMSHSFNWEWVTSLPLHVTNPNVQFGQIYHPLKDEAFDRLFLNLRGKYGAQNMSMRTTLRSILSILKEGRQFVIGFIADQVPYWSAIDHWLPFLHQDTPVFGGGEKIARRTGAVALFLSVTKEKRGQYVARFELLHDEPASLPEHTLTEMYFSVIERYLNAYPANWLWTHKRWKRTRARWEEINREKGA